MKSQCDELSSTFLNRSTGPVRMAQGKFDMRPVWSIVRESSKIYGLFFLDFNEARGDVSAICNRNASWDKNKRETSNDRDDIALKALVIVLKVQKE